MGRISVTSRAPKVAGLLVAGLVSSVQDASADEKPPPPTALTQREPWTTSRVHGTPDPPDPYRLENAFPKIHFYEPLELIAVPGSQRWACAERRGRIYTFDNDPKATQTQLLADLGRTVYGLALHPKFDENGFVFVVYVRDPAKEEPDGSRLVRFKLKTTVPPVVDAASETLFLTWPSGGHNGGCIRFGPDGYLYLATGDGSGIADGLETGQKLGDLLGCILRIEVDQGGSDRPYRIPADNPFVGQKDARPEVWAYGLRQAWKFSFDRETGWLFAGEVGQDLWEMVHRIERGGNYGWSVMEGSHPFRPARRLGPTPILPPIIEHSHADFRSLTGGYFYRGRRLPELAGAYLYGDYDTGRVWMLRHDGQKTTENRELADTQLRIVAWGQDSAGEVYAVDFMGGGIHRLAPAPPPPAEAPTFPTKLSETGLFASTKDHQPAKGLIGYSVNSELWSDGATKERYLALPGNSKIEYETVTYPQPAPGAVPGWRLPTGTVLVKTFSLETEAGNPQSRRRLETRLLHAERVPGTEEVGDQVWYGYTYVWNDQQTDAFLLEAKGLDREYLIKDPTATGGVRRQIWHFPSRAECTMCHTFSAKYALGINTLQLNKDHDYGGIVANQLAAFERLGLFTSPLPDRPENLPRLVNPHDAKKDINERARSYLHANCSHCHRKWGGGNAEFQLLITLPIAELGIVGTKPGHGTFERKDARILTPGFPDRSLLSTRMQLLGLGRMPHIASKVVDHQAVALIEEWIRSMPQQN